MLRYGSSGPQQIIQILALVQPWPFFIQCRTFGHIALTLAECLLDHRDTDDITTVGNHVFVQFHIITERIPPIQISLPVVVDEDRGVYVSPFALRQRLAQRVVKRTIRAVRHGHTDGTASRLHRHGNVSVKLSVTLHALHRPLPTGKSHRTTLPRGRSSSPCRSWNTVSIRS